MTTLLPLDFHPVLREWWAGRFSSTGAEPTEAQLDGWRAIRRGEDTLIAAPTGSGKTLAAFLTAIDQLLREGMETGGLPDEVRVIYVSPLKALSADIHKNLAEPRREIHALAPQIKITAAVRSGDTPQPERAAMLRTPPHILVTTPESLYLLLTAERSRQMLKTARLVIVDEIHAVLQSRRGAHLALSLERLDHVCGRPLQRIGLSATQKPIEEVARFLTRKPCTIVDKGHRRKMDLAVEVPKSPLEAVMSHEVWAEIYQRLVQLIEEHRTTLIFVNKIDRQGAARRHRVARVDRQIEDRGLDLCRVDQRRPQIGAEIEADLDAGAGDPAEVPADVEPFRREDASQSLDRVVGKPMHLERLRLVEVVERRAVPVRRDHQVAGRVRELVEEGESALAAVDHELRLVLGQRGGAAEDAFVSVVSVLDVLEPPRRPQLLHRREATSARPRGLVASLAC